MTAHPAARDRAGTQPTHPRKPSCPLTPANPNGRLPAIRSMPTCAHNGTFWAHRRANGYSEGRNSFGDLALRCVQNESRTVTGAESTPGAQISALMIRCPPRAHHDANRADPGVLSLWSPRMPVGGYPRTQARNRQFRQYPCRSLDVISDGPALSASVYLLPSCRRNAVAASRRRN